LKSCAIRAFFSLFCFVAAPQRLLVFGACVFICLLHNLFRSGT